MAGLASALGAVLLVAAPQTDSEKARAVLTVRGCKSCHDSAVSTEHPQALAVFDLREADWSARMSTGQLRKLLTRLRSAPAADREVVSRFIETESRRRAR